MRISISNIAWDLAEDEAVAALLGRWGVDAIDIAPGKYFPNPGQASAADFDRVLNWWKGRGVTIAGMQALLFGTTGLNVFGSAQAQGALLAHLAQVCRVGKGIGATRLVFGSPRNRDRAGLDDAQALKVAVDFFRRAGDAAAASGVILCLEPNPPCYGANFMTTAAETAAVVRAIDHPAIRAQLDTGALAINGEDPAAVLSDGAGLIGHIHASEPNLVPLGDGGADHGAAAAAVRRWLPGHIVCVEMVATAGEPHLAAIDRALGVATRWYGDTGDAA